jgi:hypothetical protein
VPTGKSLQIESFSFELRTGTGGSAPAASDAYILIARSVDNGTFYDRFGGGPTTTTADANTLRGTYSYKVITSPSFFTTASACVGSDAFLRGYVTGTLLD